jgi:hypothetical protein
VGDDEVASSEVAEVGGDEVGFKSRRLAGTEPFTRPRITGRIDDL